MDVNNNSNNNSCKITLTTVREAPIITTPSIQSGVSQWNTIDIIQGNYLSKLLWKFYHLGVWSDIFSAKQHSEPFDAQQYAEKKSWDVPLFIHLLDFFCHTTTLLQKKGQVRYQISDEYKTFEDFSHVIHKLLGTYSPIIDHLEEALTNKIHLGNDFMDPTSLTAAFSEQYPTKWIHELIEQHLPASEEPIIMGDLGCGTATWLINTVPENFDRMTTVSETFFWSKPDFSDLYQGWGVDASTSMVDKGIEKIKQKDLSHRIKLYLGDARDLEKCVPSDHLKQTQVILGGSILNEFCRFGKVDVITFLKSLLQTLPKAQIFILTDYYGKLGFSESIPHSLQHNLLHDVAQALSGQGIPFSDIETWSEVYFESGWKLVFQHRVTGQMDSFIHIIERATD